MRLFRSVWLCEVSLCNLVFIACVALYCQSGAAQVVQLPTMGTFSVQTTVSAPDSGAAYAGGGRYSSSGTNQRGYSKASGSSKLANGTSVHATVIDLNELDRLIRSQSVPKPYDPDLSADKSTVKSNYPSSQSRPAQPPHYAYLMAMSHPGADDERALDDVRYYLSLASEAKRKSHWGAVELYYQLAWKSLPESRRNSALASLIKSRDKSMVPTDPEGPKASSRSNPNSF